MTQIYVFNSDALDAPDIFEKALSRVSDERRRKVLKFRQHKDRKLSLGAGMLLEYVLKWHLSEEEYTNKLVFGSNGKPGIENEKIFFNLSHSGRYAVCAVSDRPVGIDVEEIKPANKTLINHVCTEKEKEYLEGLTEDKQNETFTRIWTVKESAVKCDGTGLLTPPKNVEADMDAGVVICNGVNRFIKEYPLDGHRLTVCSEKEVFPETAETLTLEDLMTALDECAAE